MNSPTSTPKSCFNCPSLLDANSAAVFFRKSVGVPVCARYGKLIGSVNSDDRHRETVAKQHAKNCDSFGEERPASPDWNNAIFQVMLPDPQLVGEVKRTSPEIVKSCASCENFVREDIVARDLGWFGGLCAAKGRIVMANRYTYEARDCDQRSFGRVRSDLGNLMLLPEYSADFAPTGDPVKNYFRQKAQGFTEPAEWPTDRPVSSDDESHGIRAWRKFMDPETGNEAFLPVYRTDFFSEAEQEKIPRTGDDEHPEDYVDHNFFVYKVSVLWTELDETPAMWGIPGVGKTELGRHLAWLMNIPYERFSITGSTELEELAGRMHFSPEKGTYWTDGRLTLAWGKPNVITLDEPNTGQPDVWQFLRPLTDNSKQLVLDMHDGRRVSRHNDCYPMLAMNPAWDAKNVGAHMIGDADANRLMHMQLDLPPAELEREIIRSRCKHDGWEIPKEKLDTIMAIATDLRALCKDDTLPISWAIRPQLKVARSSRWFDWMTVYRMASADFLEPEAQKQLLDVVRSHIA